METIEASNGSNSTLATEVPEFRKDHVHATKMRESAWKELHDLRQASENIGPVEGIVTISTKHIQIRSAFHGEGNEMNNFFHSISTHGSLQIAEILSVEHLLGLV